MEGTKSENIIPLLQKIPQRKRNKVKEITLDLAGNMGLIAKKCFPNASQVIDRFHVQQLATDALQEIRITYRWEAIDAENQAIEEAKTSKVTYIPEVLSNGDTLKQLLARSRYLLYKKEDNWTAEQQQEPDYFLTNTLHYERLMTYHRNFPGYSALPKIKCMPLQDLPDGMNRWNNLALNRSTLSLEPSSITTRISSTTLTTEAPMHPQSLLMLKSKPSELNTEGLVM
jgi:hypothetical protein